MRGRRREFWIRMSERELAELDAIGRLARLDRSKMVRHLVQLAYRDMVKCRPELAIDLAPGGPPGSISAEIPPTEPAA